MYIIDSQITGSPMFVQGQIKEKNQISKSLDVREIHTLPVVSSHKGPVTRIMSPFDDIIMLRVILPRLHWVKLTGQVEN